MPISWYPGHMHKATKELKRLLTQVHLLVEVRDARIPQASSNPVLGELAPDKPRILILNKADLADEDNLLAWQSHLEGQRSACLLNGRDRVLGTTRLLACADRLVGDSPAGPAGLRSMVVVGIPNVGKSSLINQFAGRKVARTGNEPAVTKGQQNVRLDGHWRLVDTPGLLWPRLDDQHAAYLLAMLGSIRNTAVDNEDVAWFAAEFLHERHPEALRKRYGEIPAGEPAEAVLTAVAHSLGAVGRGGRTDWPRAADLLLNDLRSGKLGCLSLERAPD